MRDQRTPVELSYERPLLRAEWMTMTSGKRSRSSRWNGDCLSSAVRVLSVLVMVIAFVGAFGLPEAGAQAYEWLDEHGLVNRSDALPPEGTPFRELRVVEGVASMTALERRTLEIINEQALTTEPPLALPIFSQRLMAARGS